MKNNTSKEQDEDETPRVEFVMRVHSETGNVSLSSSFRS